MAKKGRRTRRKFNLRRVRSATALTIGALSSLDVVSGAGSAAVADKLRIISIDGTWSWSNVGAVIDDSLEFGVAHSDYSAAEIEECLEATASIDLGDKIAQEMANRLVRSIGVFSNATSVAAAGGATFNDGNKIKTRLNWLLSEGDTLGIWARNGSGTVYTTGSTLRFLGSLWVKD